MNNTQYALQPGLESLQRLLSYLLILYMFFTEV